MGPANDLPLSEPRFYIMARNVRALELDHNGRSRVRLLELGAHCLVARDFQGLPLVDCQ